MRQLIIVWGCYTEGADERSDEKQREVLEDDDEELNEKKTVLRKGEKHSKVSHALSPFIIIIITNHC